MDSILDRSLSPLAALKSCRMSAMYLLSSKMWCLFGRGIPTSNSTLPAQCIILASARHLIIELESDDKVAMLYSSCLMTTSLQSAQQSCFKRRQVLLVHAELLSAI